MRQGLTLLFSLLGAAALSGAQKLADLGPEWFGKLRDPATRLDALYEWKKVGTKPERLPTMAEFAAENLDITVFPCPQPGMEQAWAVLSPRDWHHSQRILVGLDTECYEPHPMETERRAAWKAELPAREAAGVVWQADEPWFGSAWGFLVDSNGKQLAEWFFLGAGVLGDFTGDGCLDLVQVGRWSTTGKTSKLDAIGIGPVDADKPRYSKWLANLRDGSPSPRQFWFEVRQNGAQLDLAFVPTAGGEAFVYRGTGPRFEPVGPVPEGVHHIQKPLGDHHHGYDPLLKKIGIELHGFGTDDVEELDARVARWFPDDKWHVKALSVPPFGEMSPREAALAMVEHDRDPLERSRYDLESFGEPVPIPESGWLELDNDGGGWGPPSSLTWWLKAERAELWKIADGRVSSVEVVDRAETAWAIAFAHEMDRVRTVPKHPRAPAESDGMGGGDDHVMERVRARSHGPERHATSLPFQALSLWSQARGPYDRNIAGALAVVAAGSFPKKGDPIEIDLRAQYRQWLDPRHDAPVPPALLHAALKAIATRPSPEELATLKKLQAHFAAETSATEQRLAALETELKAAHKKRKDARGDRPRKAADRALNGLLRERRALRETLTGERSYELRKDLATLLKELGN